MAKINLTAGNEKLTKLKTLRKDEWLHLLLNQLPNSMQAEVNMFYTALTGEVLEPEETVTVIKYVDGFYERSYAPAIYSSEKGELLLVLGSKRIVLTPELLKKFDAEIVEFKFEQYDEICLQLMYADPEDDDNILQWPFILKLNEENYKIEEAKLKVLLKKKTTEPLASCLFIKKENSGNYSDEKPGVITELPQNVDLPVVEVKPLEVKAKGGGKRLTHIVTVQLEDETEKRIWANGDINDIFFCGGVITQETVLNYFTRKKGEKERVYVDLKNVEYEVADLEESLKL